MVVFNQSTTPPLDKFSHLVSLSDSLWVQGSINDGNETEEFLSISQLAFMHETLLDSVSKSHTVSERKKNSHSLSNVEDNETAEFLQKILGDELKESDIASNKSYHLLLSTFNEFDSFDSAPNRLLLAYQFLLRYSRNSSPFDSQTLTLLHNLSSFALPHLFCNASSPELYRLPLHAQVRDAFIKILLSPLDMIDSKNEEEIQSQIEQLLSKCVSHCSRVVHSSIFSPGGEIHVQIHTLQTLLETACRILVSLLDSSSFAAVSQYRDIILDQMQKILLDVTFAIAYEHTVEFSDESDNREDEVATKTVSLASYSTILLRPITGLLLPKLYEYPSALQQNRSKELWRCLMGLLSQSSESLDADGNHLKRCRRWDDLAPTIAMGILCTKNVLSSLLPCIIENATKNTNTNEWENFYKSILSCLCRYGSGSMGGRMQTNKGVHVKREGIDDEDDCVGESMQDADSRDAIDQILRRRAIYVLRLIVEIYSTTKEKHKSKKEWSREGELESMLQDVAKEKKNKKTKRFSNKFEESQNIRSIWKKFIICYETLEMEGEQHLIDPIFPVLSQLCSMFDKGEASSMLVNVSDDEVLPQMTFDWVGALLTRVFLSETPTVRKLALYRFFNGDAGIQISDNKNSNKANHKIVTTKVINESYLSIFLKSYDSLSGGGGIGTVIQFENASGKVQSNDIAPLFLSFLTDYFAEISEERRGNYLKYVLSEDCLLKLRAKTAAIVMNSIKAACLEMESVKFHVDHTTLNQAMQAFKKLLSTGGVIPAVRNSLLEAFAVLLSRCTYGRGKDKPDPHLVLKILTLFPSKPSEGSNITIRTSKSQDVESDEETNLVDSSLQSWICHLGTQANESAACWSENAGAACASSFVLGQLVHSSPMNNDAYMATSTKTEREMGAAIAKLCALGTAKSNSSMKGASSLLWPAIHRGLKGTNSEILALSPKLRGMAMRAMILFEFACLEKAIGGVGNGEALFLSSPLPNGEKREIMSPPPAPIEDILKVACTFLRDQLENVALLQIEGGIVSTASNSSRSGSTNQISSHFSQVLTQLMSLRFAFPSSIKISEFCDEMLINSFDKLTLKQSIPSQELAKHASLVYAALLCWGEINASEERLDDVCNLLLTMQFREESTVTKNIQQASRSIFQYAKWGALSLLISKIEGNSHILQKVCESALDSVNATPSDALLPLFDCCVSALKLYTKCDNDSDLKEFSADIMDRMVCALFAILKDTSNSLTRMQMLNQICVVLFRSSLLNWEYEVSSFKTIQSAFRDLMSMAGTKRPHIAKTVISRITVAWLGDDGMGKPAVPYRQDILDLLVYKECRTEGGIASVYQEEQEGKIMDEDVGSGQILAIPDETHELSVVRGFVLIFLSKLPQKPQDEVLKDLIHWIILSLFETICNKQGSPSSLMTGSVEYCRRIRAWQALCLLSRFVTSDIAAEVCNHVFESLARNMHGQIRYFCEIFTIRCTKMHPKCFGERYVTEINRIDLSLQQVASLMIIGGNLVVGDAKYSVPFLQSGISLHNILAGVIPWLSSTQGFSRAIAQLLVHQLIPKVIDISDLNEQDKNQWYLRSIYKFLDQNVEMKRLRKKQNKFFSRYAIDSICTPEGLLSIPVDSGDEANPPHLVDIIKRCLEEVYEEAHELEAPMWKQVEAILQSTNLGDSAQNAMSMKPEDDIELTFQRKILPHDTLNLALEQARELTMRNGAGKKKRPLIVCAVLVDKAPNLAGLARTAEIFAADRLVVPDANVRKMDNFKSISVGAGEWVEIEECKEKDLLPWLNERKQEGYSIVGLEQTSSSICITDFKFKERTVILLGKEKEGIPVEYLQAVDTCIEIPQLGIIRSLNVHVSGALAIWEYSKQRMTE